MIYLLVKIAETRLSILLKKERELLEVINTEEYGESRYFNDKETTAMSINSTKNLINHFSEKLISLGVYDSM
ncbi:hypothetical protein [Cellulophaga sp. RHA19]|uniref:hypothetical protein n=1 Tax=Cellulophaga sp. RHA19 TaxID=1798237 RepID=UPI0012FDBD90|nr:hypothetical protein [Cellulophaga sp. RHA19]